MRFPTVVFALLVSSAAIANPDITSSNYRVINNIVYAPEYALALDLYIPNGSGLHPTVVYFHGGGFRDGDKSEAAAQLGAIVATHGYILASANYRLLPDYAFPAPEQDAWGAVRFLRANSATYGIDPTRIALTGSSAGSRLATMAGTMANDSNVGTVGGNTEQSSAVIGIAAISGQMYQSDLYELSYQKQKAAAWQFSCQPYLLTDQPCTPPEGVYLPQYHITAVDPPIQMLQGALDTELPPDNARDLCAYMNTTGEACWYIEDPNMDHGINIVYRHKAEYLTFLDAVFTN